MTTMEQIEEAIESLPPLEQDRLFLRLEEQYSARFDAQIESDLRGGALDKLIDEALLQAEAGNLREL